MYQSILALHSVLRWFVLASLLYALIRSYSGWMGNKAFTAGDGKMRLITVTIAHLQLVVGIILYFVSPIIDHFLHNMGEDMHNRPIRFFGMEHSIMMLAAVVFMTIGSAKAKRKANDKDKFKTLAIFFTIGLIIILASIPWPFSPMAPRPYFRGF